MKYTFLVLIILLNTISYAQNKRLIKETLYAQSINNLDIIASEKGYNRKEYIFINVHFKSDSIGEIFDIKVSGKSKAFGGEIKSLIKQIPLLDPEEYVHKGNVMKYGLKMSLKLPTKSEHKKIIAKKEKIKINFKRFIIKEYFPLKTIEMPEMNENDISIVEDIPITENCKNLNLANNTEIKRCITNEIKMHVNRTFDTEMFNNLPKGVVHKVIVKFYISTKGEIVNISAQGDTLELIEEGIRTINSFPNLYKGGQINGEFVNIKYSLPIMFSIN